LFILALSLPTVVATVAHAQPAAARDASLDERLSARGIRDTRVRAAFARVPREVFVPADAPERAYDDKTLPAGYSQTITQPYLLARMAELLQLKAEHRVLEVGGGTGYPAAILAELAHEVYSVGAIPELTTTERLRLTRAGYQNVHVKLGDGGDGWREYAPYDAALVTSIAPRVPPAAIEQLAEGGVLVMVVGPPRGRQVLIRGIKKGFKLHAKEILELRSGGAEPSRDGAGRKRADGATGGSPDGTRGSRPPRDSDESRSDR
jgi:protein-L-isoaspartate(D-aspartate) O-methyltransferase